MATAEEMDPIKIMDSQEEGLSTEDDNKEGQSPQRSEEQQVRALPAETRRAPPQDSCASHESLQTAVDYEFKDGLLFVPSSKTFQGTDMQVNTDEDAGSIESSLDTLSEEEVCEEPSRPNIDDPPVKGPSHEENVAAQKLTQDDICQLQLKKAFEKDGYTGLHDEIEKQLQSWEDVHLNIAVIGMTGTGKSTFINAVLGRNVAETGSTEMTREHRAFSHPDYKNVKFWDIPGVGTSNFPKDTYLDKINFEQYDVFLLLFCNRVFIDTTWLVETILKTGKKAYIVRTMIDIANQNVKWDYDNKKTEKDVHELIIKEVIQYMPIIDRDHIFLICCRQPDFADFPKLLKTILDELPELKRTTLALILSATSDEIITAKVKELRKRIKSVSIKSSIGTVVPIAGICVQVGALYHEVMFYRQQLGTDVDSIKKIAERIGCEENKIYVEAQLAEKAISRSVRAFAAFAANAGGYFFFKETAKVVVPVIGTLISGVSNYQWSVSTLDSFLSNFEIEAKRLNRFLHDWTKEKRNKTE